MLVHWISSSNDEELIFNSVSGLDTHVVYGIPNDRRRVVEEAIFKFNRSGIGGTWVEATFGDAPSVAGKDFFGMLPVLGCLKQEFQK